MTALCLSFRIALRYALSNKAHKFAAFVALMAACGTAIGVCALITVSSVMGGLQDRLKDAVLDTTAHVIVNIAPDRPEDLAFVASLPQVQAYIPYTEGQVLLQSGKGMTLATLQGYNSSELKVTLKNRRSLIPGDAAAAELPQEQQPLTAAGRAFAAQARLHDSPQPGTFAVLIPESFMLREGVMPGDEVRLISTSNARYTPVGLTPSQRLFEVQAAVPLPSPGNAINLIAAREDTQRLLREHGNYVRLFLQDPFDIEAVAAQLTGRNLSFTDWRAKQGEFFKAVAMEKVSMSVMLCLIILVAAFNILSALTMTVNARIHEIAVLKTLGCTEGMIVRIFMLQGLIIAGAGTCAGIAAGIPFALNAQSILGALGIRIVASGTLPVSVSWLQVAVIAVSCLLLAMLCTLYPAIKAGRCPPAQNLVAL